MSEVTLLNFAAQGFLTSMGFILGIGLALLPYRRLLAMPFMRYLPGLIAPWVTYLFVYLLWKPFVGVDAFELPHLVGVLFWVIYGLVWIISIAAFTPWIDHTWRVTAPLAAITVVLRMWHLNWEAPYDFWGWFWLFVGLALPLIFGLAFARLFVVAVIVLLIAALVAPAVMNWLSHNENWFGNATNSMVDEVTPDATEPPPLPYTQREESQCVQGFNVKFDPNKGDDEVTGGIDTTDPKKAVNQMLAVAKHDPRYLLLQIQASPYKAQYTKINSYKSFTGTGKDNGCYNQAGRDAYYKMQALWLTPKFAKITSVKNPGRGVNTGTPTNGTPYAHAVGYVSGDTRALKIQYSDGSVVYVLHKCGNVFVPGTTPPPGVPTTVPPEVKCKVITTPPPGTHYTSSDHCTVAPDKAPPKKCKEPTPYGKWPLCKDGPERNVLRNPAVPDQVKGPGTTPVGTDPGPATDPVDSPTGCDGACTGGGSGSGGTDSSGTPQPAVTTPVPQVSSPEHVFSTPIATPQTSDPIQVCGDADGDGFPDDC